MSIQLGSNFQVNTTLPIDSRNVVADMTALNAIDPTVRYDGLLTYVVATQSLYQLKGGILNTNWQLAGSAGGGGGSLQWVEGPNAAIPDVDANGNRVYYYSQAQAQNLFATIKVPAGYVAGKQIALKLSLYSPDTSGTLLMQTIATLLRSGIDPFNSTTNQRTSTNTAITMATALQYRIQLVQFDLSDTAGKINGIAISPNDLVVVNLTRSASDTAPSDASVLVYAAEVSFQ